MADYHDHRFWWCTNGTGDFLACRTFLWDQPRPGNYVNQIWTLGAYNFSDFLESIIDEPRQLKDAQLCFSDDLEDNPTPPPGFQYRQIYPDELFHPAILPKLGPYVMNYKTHAVDFASGRRDSTAYVNTLLKVWGVPEASRSLGSGRGIRHRWLLEESLFRERYRSEPPGNPALSDPNLPNPPGTPNLELGQRLHIVVAGDWLSKIAQTYLGNPMLYNKIYNWTDDSNGNWNRKEIGPNPDLIRPGMRIIIPAPGSIT